MLQLQMSQVTDSETCFFLIFQVSHRVMFEVSIDSKSNFADQLCFSRVHTQTTCSSYVRLPQFDKVLTLVYSYNIVFDAISRIFGFWTFACTIHSSMNRHGYFHVDVGLLCHKMLSRSTDNCYCSPYYWLKHCGRTELRSFINFLSNQN